MRRKFVKRGWLLGLVTALVLYGGYKLAFSYQAAFARTGADQFEIKPLPASVALEVTAEGDYFRQNNSLFRQLFRHISSHNISMTVPVEADMTPAAMRFYVGDKDRDKLSPELREFTRELPQRTVASLGKRGGYQERNVRAAMAELEQKLAGQRQWQADGEPYAVFWHGPFIPDFFKRFEIHQPVKPTSDAVKPE